MRKILTLLLVAGCSGMPMATDGGPGGGSAGGGRATGAGAAGGGMTGGGLVGGGTASCSQVNEAAVTLDVAIDGGVIPRIGLDPNTGFFIETSTIVTRVAADGGVQFIELAGPSGPFLVTLGAPQLPAAFVTPGETLGLRLAVRAHPGFGGATTNIGLTLRRGTEVIGFAFTGRQILSPIATPDFSPERISITPGAVECETPVQIACGRRLYLADVSLDGGTTVTLSTGQTGAVGPFDVTIESFEGATSNGSCDGPGRTELAGVRVR